MQQGLAIKPLPQHASNQTDNASETQFSSTGQPGYQICGAFDALTGFLLLGCSSGSVSCLHLARYGSTARRLLGRHMGRVTAACLFPWHPPAAPCTRTASFFATCSADACIKIWTSDPKALHTTDACLQTLRGHKAAVISLATVQVAHAWCLLSGGADGQLLLWRPACAAEARDQQLSGAAMLAQLVPHMQLVEAPLYASSHWVLDITCLQQQTEAGLAQGAFVVLAQQPLLRVPLSRSAISDTAAGMPASAAVTAQQHRSSTCSTRGLQASSTTLRASLLPSRLACHSPLVKVAAEHSSTATSSRALASTQLAAGNTLASCSSNRSTLQQLKRPDSGGGSSFQSSSCCSSQAAAAGHDSISEVEGTQQVSMFAAAFIPQQMAVLTLAYDGACRLHSVVEGVMRCCWRSPTGSNYVAMDVCSGLQGQIVLLGDDRGSLHLYSLASEKLLATKQISNSRITAVVSCDTSSCAPSTSSADGSSNGSSKGVSSVQFAVLSEGGIGLWQLQQGLSHGIMPRGHQQGVTALQLCWRRGQAAMQDLPEERPAAPALSKSSSTCSRGSLALVPDTALVRSYSTVGSMRSDGSQTGATAATALGFLMSAGLDGRVIQWELPGAGAPVAVQCVLAAAGAEGASELTAMTYLTAAAVLVTGHDNGQVLLWCVDTGSHTVLGPTAHSNSVSCLALAVTAKGDEQLVSGGFDGCVCLWEPRQVRGVKPHLLAKFQAHGCRPRRPRMLQSPQQQQRQPQHKRVLQGQSVATGIACRSPRVLTGCSSSSQHGYAIGGEQVVSSRQGQAHGGRSIPPAGVPWQHGRQHSCTADASWDKGHTAASSEVNPDTNSVLLAVDVMPPEVLAVLFEPLNQLIVTGGNDGAVKVWAGAASGTLLGQHLGHTGPINCLALDGNLLFSGSHDGTIRIWDVLPVWFTVAPAAPSAAAAACAAGTAGTGAGAVIGNRRSKHRLCPGQDPGGCCVASSTAFAVLRGHTAAVTSLAVADDSGVLVSCGADGQVLQWDYSTGQLLARYCFGEQVLTSVAVEPDAKQVYVGTSQGQLMTVAGPDHACATGCS